jgi:hypothetical protein
MKRIIIAIACLAATACDAQPTSDSINRKAQEQIELQATQSVGMPGIINFSEKKMLKMVLEKRDRMAPTVTYTIDMNGKLHKLCDSMGYGIPYATQYTSPQKVAWYSGQGASDGRGSFVVPQADPNGLFSPPSAEGTWVMCLNPKTKDADVLYIEPRVIVSPFPLEGQ